ncbi:nucleophile aminohydrolase [Naematelia encephala]|uniref:Glutathione hydrolase n=1 Tax=Naematelia encephala TaxID=71784 RepID=A0A1Y2AW96_9TREE|nr:nucleophile aminohydrolase [Naematelia encephala]
MISNDSSHRVLSGAVVSEHQLASDIGKEILLTGGNAADAIVATCIAVNTLCPWNSDIGGGGFAIIRTSQGDHHSIDFRHVAPTAVTMEWLLNKSTAIGGSAVAVPGEVKGLEAIHERYGRVSWGRLFQPSIKMAREGMTMFTDLYETIVLECKPAADGSLDHESWFATDPAFRDTFMRNGRMIPVGEKWSRPRYADTLEAIASSADAFYEGPIAESIVRTVKERGGLMNLNDMKNYKVNWNSPLQSTYRGKKIWTIPTPASGAVFLAALNILDQSPPPKAGFGSDFHRVTEALKFAYGLRTQLGDPDFVPGMDDYQAECISHENALARSLLISEDSTFPPEFDVGNDHGTSNITVADSDGLVISITTSVGLNFGSRIMVPESGIVLNSEIDDFSIEGRSNSVGYEASPANFVEGGKRPLSSSCPYIIENEDGSPIAAGGSAGGSTIISANVQVVRNLLDYGMTADESLRASRLHNQLLPDISYVEKDSFFGRTAVSGFSSAQVEDLKSKGHDIQWIPRNRSTPCVIRILPGPRWDCGGEPRKFDSGGSVFQC